MTITRNKFRPIRIVLISEVSDAWEDHSTVYHNPEENPPGGTRARGAAAAAGAWPLDTGWDGLAGAAASMKQQKYFNTRITDNG